MRQDKLLIPKRPKAVSVCSKHRLIVLIVAVVTSLVVVGFLFLSLQVFVANRPSTNVDREARVVIDGGEVQGYKVADVTIFKGIPYAKPPIEKRRWQPPERCEVGDCWNGTFHATKFGDICFQTDVMNRSIVKGKENCLFINVWAPTSNTKAKLPVLVYIHGGFLNYGSGNYYGICPNPELVSQLKIVGVSFNYRLNAFGFLSLDALSQSSSTSTSGNYGFMDQILALKWVHENIDKFNGDPGGVTVMGQSSGGTSELALLSSPMASGLFHGIIMMSASAVFNKSAADASKDNEIFLKNSNCQKSDVNATVKCLYDLSAEQVVGAIPWDVYPYWAMDNQQDLPTKGEFDGAIAVVDGYVVPQPPLIAMATGSANDVPLIVGTTAQETDFLHKKSFKSRDTFEKYARSHLVPFLGANKTTTALSMYPGNAQYSFITMGSDIAVNCPDDFIALNASRGFRNPVFRYIITSTPSNPVNVFGIPCEYAFHMWDLIAFFGFPDNVFEYKPSKRDLAFMGDLRRELGYFIHHGSVYSEDWRDYPNGTGLFTNKGVVTLINEGYHEKECSFWLENGFFSYAWIN